MPSNPIRDALVIAFQSMRTMLGGGVEIVSGEHTCMGLVSYDSTNEATERGATGQVSGTVRAILSELPEVSLTETCKVGGVEVFPMKPRIDSANAFIVFDFMSTMPESERDYSDGF